MTRKTIPLPLPGMAFCLLMETRLGRAIAHRPGLKLTLYVATLVPECACLTALFYYVRHA